MILNKGCSSLRRHGSTSPCVRTRSQRSITWLVPPAANPFRPVSPGMLAICSARQHYVIFGHRARLRTWRLPLSMSYKSVGVMCRYNFMVTVTHTIEQASRLPGHAFHELERRGRVLSSSTYKCVHPVESVGPWDRRQGQFSDPHPGGKFCTLIRASVCIRRQ
ncbi:hypothetical protein T07_10920 [Trichinella nelsoni]|uniref:Uncharacterized protein n=1 Tax=Trichinella nelsoni TaxID=6336 RepID=A0A0V0SKJ7_9BILA|nr:hypothetical protein T07_10920 [Trichinella nelsoni]